MANEKEVDPELVKRADYAYNPHPKDAQAPALDVGLVERMLCMAEAARDAKWDEAIRDAHRHGDLGLLGIEKIIASIRARLLAPAKSAGERVTLDYCDGYTNIVLDNEVWMVVIETKKAEICAAGLIATLKQEGK